MSKVLNYVVNDDGYTEDAFIKGIARLTSDVRFKFRPVPYEDRIRTLQAVREIPDPVESERAVMEIISSFILEWDITDKDGKPFPVSTDSMMALREYLRDRITEIVFYGRDPGDRDPKAPPSETTKKATDQVKQIIERNKSAAQRQVDDAKN